MTQQPVQQHPRPSFPLQAPHPQPGRPAAWQAPTPPGLDAVASLLPRPMTLLPPAHQAGRPLQARLAQPQSGYALASGGQQGASYGMQRPVLQQQPPSAFPQGFPQGIANQAEQMQHPQQAPYPGQPPQRPGLHFPPPNPPFAAQQNGAFMQPGTLSYSSCTCSYLCSALVPRARCSVSEEW